jgi:ABC-2 type transport system ATP-binding protein
MAKGKEDMDALRIEGLRKVYRNGKEALKGIDLRVEEGDFYALLGPNGAGKSSTIGIVTSLVRKTSGRILVFGHDIDRDFPTAKSMIGLVPQEINFNQFDKVADIVINQGGYYGLPRAMARARAEVYLQRLGLWEKRGDISRTLSGGMKRRLMVARALVHEPRLLILDEPTAGVDIELRRSLWGFLTELNQRGTTIILTTHYLEEAEQLCRRIAIIDQGEIVEDTQTKDLLARLHVETFVFDLAAPLAAPPVLPGCPTHLADERTLEVVLRKDQSLNEVFRLLSGQGIEVHSMRNKANRLEELFVSLVRETLQ